MFNIEVSSGVQDQVIVFDMHDEPSVFRDGEIAQWTSTLSCLCWAVGAHVIGSDSSWHPNFVSNPKINWRVPLLEWSDGLRNLLDRIRFKNLQQVGNYFQKCSISRILILGTQKWAHILCLNVSMEVLRKILWHKISLSRAGGKTFSSRDQKDMLQALERGANNTFCLA
jgi:hypothetical protein